MKKRRHNFPFKYQFSIFTLVKHLQYTNTVNIRSCDEDFKMGCDYMKIEKISDTQIRCTLNHSDLVSREIKLSELAYGTEKAKLLFHDMIEQASHQFGFEADDIPLMIEAIPVSSDCLVLIIIKVEDPEELDTRFSQFAPAADEDYDDECDDEDDDDVMDLDALLDQCTDASDSHKDSGSDNFIPMKDTLNAAEVSDGTVTESERSVTTKFYSFSEWHEASEAASSISGYYTGTSRLFKCENGKYLLSVCNDSLSNEDFLKVCNVLSEYGTKEKSNYATMSYLFEHSRTIARDNAVQILANY